MSLCLARCVLFVVCCKCAVLACVMSGLSAVVWWLLFVVACRLEVHDCHVVCVGYWRVMFAVCCLL